MKPITKSLVVNILSYLSEHGLTKGLGKPEPGKMCVEAMICYHLGLPHSDNPQCVAPSVRAFKIALNDSDWSSDQARAKGMRRIAIAQLGSNEIDELVFVKELSLATIRKIVPIALRSAAKIHPDKKHQAALNKHASECEQVSAESAAWSAARSAARSAESAARSAESAARSAAWSAAESAARSAWSARSARSADAKDQVLEIMAEAGVEALRIAKSPGCKWLNLTEK